MEYKKVASIEKNAKCVVRDDITMEMDEIVGADVVGVSKSLTVNIAADFVAIFNVSTLKHFWYFWEW